VNRGGATIGLADFGLGHSAPMRRSVRSGHRRRASVFHGLSAYRNIQALLLSPETWRDSYLCWLTHRDRWSWSLLSATYVPDSAIAFVATRETDFTRLSLHCPCRTPKVCHRIERRSRLDPRSPASPGRWRMPETSRFWRIQPGVWIARFKASSLHTIHRRMLAKFAKLGCSATGYPLPRTWSHDGSRVPDLDSISS
jgi:hypothetical protein